MLNLKKILLPVDFPVSSLSVIRQAALLARHFNSEIVLLHVATERSHAAGVPEDSGEMAKWDLLAAIVRQAQNQQDSTLGGDLGGITIRCKLVKGDVAMAIVQTAQDEKADLIMMPSHSFTFYQFLLGTTAANVVRGAECPVWTGAHVEGPPKQEFSLRSVLCAIKFGSRSELTLSWASQLATDFGARLTLVNVTGGVELWGPGGNYVDEKWRQALVGDASRQIAQLQKDTGVKADVIIGSGDVPKALSEAAKQTNADLLVTGCYPYDGHLRTHGFETICAVQIPVLNV